MPLNLKTGENKMKKFAGLVATFIIFCMCDFYCYTHLPLNLMQKSRKIPGYTIYLYLQHKFIYKGETEVDPSVLKDYKHIS